jgi:NAD(P)-dependent dehydrogenase (short-subunit alcohol dehydrogenase family)
MTVTGGRTIYELRGISYLPLEPMEPTKKGIAVTRSFGVPGTSWQQMSEAIASYATRAAEKMRRYKVAAENIFVFMHTNTLDTPLTADWTAAQQPWRDHSPMRRPASPKDIARIVMMLIASDYLTGEIVVADGRLSLT